MSEKDELEHLLDQIGDLVRMAQERGPELENDLPPDLEAKISQLEKDVEKFQELNKEILSSQNIPEDSLLDLTSDDRNLHPRDRRILHQAEQIVRNVNDAKKNLEEAVNEAREHHQITQEDKSKQPRKRKFNRFGGRKDWKPL